MLADLFFNVRARWGVLALCILASIAGGLWTAWGMPPRYVASADVVMELVRPDAQTGEVVPSRMLEDYVGTQMRLAASAATTRHMIAQFGWLDDPEIQRTFSEIGEPPENMEAWLAARLAGGVSVSVPEETNLLRLSYSAPDSETAKMLVAAVRAAFLTEVLDRKIEMSKKNAAALDNKARFALQRYLEALSKRNAYAAERGIAITQNPREEERLAQALLERDSASGLIGLRARPRPPQSAPVAGSQRARELAGIISPPAPPEGKNEVATPDAGSASVTSAVSTSRGDSHLETLKEQASLSADAYFSIIGRRNQALQDANAGETNMAAFGDATVPSDPAFPNYSKIIGVSLALGLILGVEVALMLELLDRRVRRDKDVEEGAQLPVLAVVRHRRPLLRISLLRAILYTPVRKLRRQPKIAAAE